MKRIYKYFWMFLRLQDARNKLLRFMDGVKNIREWGLRNLPNDLLDLKVTIQGAFSFYLLDSPGVNSSLTLPEKIFESKEAETRCNDLVQEFGWSDFIVNADELLNINDEEGFLSKYNEFGYDAFVTDILNFVDKFTECTSYFKNYISDLHRLQESVMSFIKTDVVTGVEFIFEKESKVRRIPVGYSYMTYKDLQHYRMSLPKKVYVALYEIQAALSTRASIHHWADGCLTTRPREVSKYRSREIRV